MVLKNRHEAGKLLGEELAKKYHASNIVVLALPRGGVPVGYEVAKKLNAQFDVLISRKVGAPRNKEFGVGAVSEGDVIIVDRPTVALFKYAMKDILPVIAKVEEEVEQKIRLYRGGRSLPLLEGKVAIIVDDGLATGVTARAALESVQMLNPDFLIFAAPVCEASTSQVISRLVDDIICLEHPQEMQSVSLWYEDFAQVTDDEVIRLLHSSKQPQSFI